MKTQCSKNVFFKILEIVRFIGSYRNINCEHWPQLVHFHLVQIFLGPVMRTNQGLAVTLLQRLVLVATMSKQQF